MIPSNRDNVIPLANAMIEIVKQFAQRRVRIKQDCANLGTVGPLRMPNDIERRKTDGQKICTLATSELELFDLDFA